MIKNIVLEGHVEFNVSQQMKANVGAEREYDLDGFIDVLGVGVGTRVQGKAKFIRTNRGILAKGNAGCKLPVECGRCLKVFDLDLALEIEEEYFPTVDVNNGTALEIPDDPGSSFIDDHHIIDLKEVIRQHALLAIPMKPLCKEDCAGLCSICGKDLNSRQCKCNKKEIDPRWAKLVELNAAIKVSKNQKKETK
ncbi:MAG TPA: DUF177 domain-containing protein [Dehalococcoidales bacterium]|nr:DUF177 domain-containing protein [Dehalococcoidales bacterium]